VVVQHLEQYHIQTMDTYTIGRSRFANRDPENINAWTTGHMTITLRPQSCDDSCGPTLPQNATSTALVRERVILQLQLCGDPLPSTDQFHGGLSVATTSELRSAFSGRLLSGDGSNPSLLKYWIDRCRHLHQTDCAHSLWPASASSRLSSLLLIDVQKMCIVTAPQNCQYVALSYCWGNAMTFRHLICNSKLLKTANALHSRDIPWTIRDAISLVQMVSERYLWVDALCIFQDDVASRTTQLAQMGLIYSMATFTIIAAAGSDANAGLPGVRPGTRVTNQELVTVGDKVMLTVIDGQYNNGLGLTCWATRAWTMQEATLSKKNN
jgi:hypothetical protein